MTKPRTFQAVGRWDAPGGDALGRLVAEGAPFALSVTTPRRTDFRDVYFDTADGALLAQDVSCVLRHHGAGHGTLVVARGFDGASDGPTGAGTAIEIGHSAVEVLTRDNAATRQLRPFVDPSALAPWLELATTRQAVHAASRRWFRKSSYTLASDTMTVRAAGLSAVFHEVAMHVQRDGRPGAADVGEALAARLGLRASTVERRVRAHALRSALEHEASARRVRDGGRVAMVALDGPRVAAVRDASGWRLPVLEGSGELTARLLLQRILGTSGGDVQLVSTTDGDREGRAPLEVWSCTGLDHSALAVGRGAVAWLPIEELLAHIETREVHDAATRAALVSLTRSDTLRWLVSLPSTAQPSGRRAPRQGAERQGAPREGAASVPAIDADLSLLSFNERVLSLATDGATPLLDRLRYVAIVGANIDEFVSVRLGRLRARGRPGGDGEIAHPARQRLRRVRARLARLYAERDAALTGTLAALRASGLAVERLQDLGAADQAALDEQFRALVYPLLTPRALSALPGYRRGVIAARQLHLAVVHREPSTGLRQLAVVAIPPSVPHFLSLPGGSTFVALEEVLRRHVPMLFPGRVLDGAYAFRVGRHADLDLDEAVAGSLLHAVDEHARRRARRPIVQVEVEPGMPRDIRRLLLRELALEPGVRAAGLDEDDVVEVPGFLDVTGFRQLADLPRAELRFAPHGARDPLAREACLWTALRREDLLVHHPYDDFAATVVRFFEAAADDPDVIAIKVSLYRTGDTSPIADALRRAALAGKEVSVFVELRARFDEERNVHWTRCLEEAGVHVVHGVPGIKTHAKVALVVRREPDGPQRYAHVATGNYNAATARLYTDLGLFTTRTRVCDDVTDLFNALTSGQVPDHIGFRDCLVAPGGLATDLVTRIAGEAAHARAGRPARIRLQVNGVADPQVVEALYDAARAGVEVDLVVRGLCTLRPGVPGHSERIRVVSLVGRYLEHARIYTFANGGQPAYFIGSADLRARNLRRRVEVLVPIVEPAQCERLDAMLDAAMADPTGWRLQSDESYTRAAASAWDEASAQARHARGMLTEGTEAS